MAGAYTAPNIRFIPPERTTCKSSMLSAPAAIPAMIVVIFPAGFTPAEATRTESNETRSLTSWDRPACSASAITGTNPAHDTRFSSSEIGVAVDHAGGSFTISAFWVIEQSGPQHSRFSCPRRHFHTRHAASTHHTHSRPTDRGLAIGRGVS